MKKIMAGTVNPWFFSWLYLVSARQTMRTQTAVATASHKLQLKGATYLFQLMSELLGDLMYT
jgi:hypothetical protein